MGLVLFIGCFVISVKKNSFIYVVYKTLCKLLFWRVVFVWFSWFYNCFVFCLGVVLVVCCSFLMSSIRFKSLLCVLVVVCWLFLVCFYSF